jgi:hypothetical protein
MWRRITAIVALSVALIGLSTVALPGPAQAASCIYPTISVYPGESGPNLRYGEVSVQFVVCDNTHPRDWTATVTKAQVNATGQNFGFFIDGTSTPTTLVNDVVHLWRLNVYAKTCVPWIGWPCHSSYTLTADFQAQLTNGTTPSVYLIRTTGYYSMVLFRTP